MGALVAERQWLSVGADFGQETCSGDFRCGDAVGQCRCSFRAGGASWGHSLRSGSSSIWVQISGRRHAVETFIVERRWHSVGADLRKAESFRYAKQWRSVGAGVGRETCSGGFRCGEAVAQCRCTLRAKDMQWGISLRRGSGSV